MRSRSRSILGSLLAALVVPSVPLALPAPVLAQAAGRTDATTVQTDDEKSARDEFLKINFIVNRELYSLAIPRYEKLLASYPEYSDRGMVHYALAVCHDHLAVKMANAASETRSDGTPSPAAKPGRDHHAKAAKAARAALDDPKFPKERHVAAQNLLAQTLLLLDDHDGAAKAYRWILTNAKGVEKALAAVGLADSEYSRGEWTAAAGAYRSAISAFPTEVDDGVRRRARFQLGMALYQQGDPQSTEAGPLFESLATIRGDIGDDALYMAALVNQKTGRLDTAERQYEQLAKLDDPTRSESGLYGLGSVLFLREKYAEAAERLDAFVQLHPKSPHVPSALLYQARALLETRKLRSAGRILLGLIDDKEVGEEAGLWLARAYASLDKHDSAITVLRKALAAHPSGTHRQLLQVELATELIAAGLLEEAEKVLAQIDDNGTPTDRTLYLRAYSLHRSKKYAESSRICVAFLAKHTGSDLARDVRQLDAENRFLIGEFEAAITSYKELAASAGESVSVKERLLLSYRVAEALFFSKRYKEAIDVFLALEKGSQGPALRSAVTADPVYESFHYLLAEAYYQTRDHARAIAMFTHYLEKKPGAAARRHEAEARFKLAHSYQLSGDAENARLGYRDAMAKDKDSRHATQMRFELGQIAFEAGDHAEATKAFEQAVESDAKSAFAPHALRFLGWIAQKDGRHDEAIGWLERVAAGDANHPAHGEGLYLLSISLGRRGDFPRARQMLQRLRNEHPDDPKVREASLQEAMTFAREGNDEKALACLEKLPIADLPIELGIRASYEKAWSLRRLDRADEAVTSYRKLLALGGKGELVDTATLELAELEFDRDKFVEAKRLLGPLATAEARSEIREKALYQLCWCSYRLDDDEGLEARFESLAADFPKSEYVVQTALLSARRHVDGGRFRMASSRFKMILDFVPRPKEAEQALISHAECLNEESLFKEAIAQLEKFRKEFADSRYSTRALFALGWANESLNRLDAAEKSYREAAKDRTGTAARAQFQLGQCKVARKKYEDAIVEFLHVVGRFGKYPEWSSRSLLQVAGCFTLLENYNDARKYYREVLSEFGDRDEAKLASEKLARLPR